jgi:hypothetical protein
MNIIKVTINNEAKEWIQEFTLTDDALVIATNDAPWSPDHERIPSHYQTDTQREACLLLAQIVNREIEDQLGFHNEYYQ